MLLRNKLLLTIGGILVGIQFFQPPKNNDKNKSINHVEYMFNIPSNVKSILINSCYDCHSNNTEYPLYSRLQPIAWYMSEHIKQGKEELNFSEFGTYSIRKQRNKLRAIASQIESGDMPLASYVLIHQNVTLSPIKKQVMLAWIDSVERKL